MSLVVPARSPEDTRRPSQLAMGEQSDQREQPQQHWCGAPYRHIRPLTLRLESEMPTHLLEGYFQLPTHHEPREDLLGIGLEVGTQPVPGF